MTVEEALPWLREHREELLETIRQGKYKLQPIRRKKIPKPDGRIRKLGIPTVVDRICAHTKPLKKAKAKLKELTSRSQGRNGRAVMQKVKVYIRGWLGYFGIANMRAKMRSWECCSGKPIEMETLERNTGRLPGVVFSRTQLQTRDSQQLDTLKF